MDIRSAAVIAYGFVPGEGPGWEAQEANERERYEREVVEQARDIVAGRSGEQPGREHLRVLLSWLDGEDAGPEQGPEVPAHGVPF